MFEKAYFSFGHTFFFFYNAKLTKKFTNTKLYRTIFANLDFQLPLPLTKMRIEINKDRINYLLALYKMSADDLLSLLNEGRKRLLTKDVLQGDSMDISLLKKIDAIFQKGLNFYCDFSSLKPTASSSVFFRKSQFNTELARESIRVVHEFETLKQTIDSYNKLSRLNVESSVKHCTTDDNPFDVALKAREYFYPGVIKEDRAFLKALIGKCAEQNKRHWRAIYVSPPQSLYRSNISITICFISSRKWSGVSTSTSFPWAKSSCLKSRVGDR